MAKLIYGCGPNSFYATKIEVSDPYVWLQDESGESHVLLNELEIGHAKRDSVVKHVHPLRTFIAAAQEQGNAPTMPHIIQAFLAHLNIKAVDVPSDFPAGLMVNLQALGITVTPVTGSFFPERAVKTADEIEKVRLSQAVNEQAFLRAFDVFKQAKIEADNTLSYNGKPLTSEIVQGLMNARAAELGAKDFNGGPIVAGGALSADPHERGKGVLKAGELIIIDSFPRSDNGYNGDLTRTIVKGEANAWQAAVYASVKKAQQLALDMVSPHVTGAEVHAAVAKSMADDGFETGVDENGNAYGFFHGTGHALGVEVHDDGPGVSPRNPNNFEVGMVVTIEPGLYYPGKGGVRIEDIVTVTKDGCKNLTTLPKTLEVDKM